jgi:hypothetical protein
MKTFSRVILIFVAALLVSGATFVFGQSSQASAIINGVSGRSGFEQRRAGRQPRVEVQLPNGQTTADQPPAGFEGRGRGGESSGFNIAGIGPVIKNAGIMLGICIVLIVVSLGWRVLRRGSKKPKAEPLTL